MHQHGDRFDAGVARAHLQQGVGLEEPMRRQDVTERAHVKLLVEAGEQQRIGGPPDQRGIQAEAEHRGVACFPGELRADQNPERAAVRGRKSGEAEQAGLIAVAAPRQEHRNDLQAKGAHLPGQQDHSVIIAAGVAVVTTGA